MNWVTSSVIATFAFAGIGLIIKRLTQFELRSENINFYFSFFTALVFLIFSTVRDSSLKIGQNSLPWFVLLALVAFIANYFSVNAIASAPNPGYVRAIIALQAVIVTVVSLVLFKSSLSLQAILGITFSLLGIYLLASSKL